MFDRISIGWVVIIVSELVALALIWRLWRSDDHLFFKISLSCLALLPVLGPLLTLWIANFPNVAPRILQDRKRYSSDVFDRWQHVLAEKNPAKRLQLWRGLYEKHRDEDP